MAGRNIKDLDLLPDCVQSDETPDEPDVVSEVMRPRFFPPRSDPIAIVHPMMRMRIDTDDFAHTSLRFENKVEEEKPEKQKPKLPSHAVPTMIAFFVFLFFMVSRRRKE